MASITVTYILWLFFGWFGWHHLYLGRVNQAIICCLTFGGVFGIGWIRDCFKIPSYVREANSEGILDIRKESVCEQRPDCSAFQKLGMFVISLLSASVFSFAVPECSDAEWHSDTLYSVICHLSRQALYAFGSIIGTYLMANMGNRKFKKKYPIIGCIVSSIIFPTKEKRILVPIFTSFLTMWKGLKWYDRQNKARRKRFRGYSRCLHILTYNFWLSLYMSFVILGVYNNVQVPAGDGDKTIPVSEALSNFFKSEDWNHIKVSLKRSFIFCKLEGWRRTFGEAMKMFDLSEETDAFEIMGFERFPSLKEIKERCFTMTNELHADTQKDKAEAEERLKQVQKACKVLINMWPPCTKSEDSELYSSPSSAYDDEESKMVLGLSGNVNIEETIQRCRTLITELNKEKQKNKLMVRKACRILFERWLSFLVSKKWSSTAHSSITSDENESSLLSGSEGVNNKDGPETPQASTTSDENESRSLKDSKTVKKTEL